ncbi:MAG: sugar ABC transporter ATP-binding protein [Pseudomonas sp.]
MSLSITSNFLAHAQTDVPSSAVFEPARSGSGASVQQGEGTPLIKLCGIGKSFPGVRALQDVSLSLWPGEVHMIMGENGAGKSTLMKIMCGAYKADEGHFEHLGRQVTVRGAADARKLGVAVIFQEYSLVPYLNVAQNIFLGREPMRRIPGVIDHARMHREAGALLQRLGSDIDTWAMVENLSVAQHQVVEIAKALSQDAKVLVLDEPTAALSVREAEQLFKLVADLRAQGVAMAYISHRMDEVFALGDRISVMRDGKMVATLPANQATPDELVSLMVGRKVDRSYARGERPTPGAVVLQVENLAGTNGLAHASLDVRAHEIVGLAGLVGSGRTELVRTIFGADSVAAGTVTIRGKPFNGNPSAARRQGLALIPEDRKRQGIALERTVGDNLLAASLPRHFRSGWFFPSRADRLAGAKIEQLSIATSGPRKPAGKLSGGNQQKIVIGKWLLDDAEIFIFDEPTRGIDVGAKEQIFALMDVLVRQGRAVLMISSEIGEIVRVCDRAYVMKDMRIVGEVPREQLSESTLVRMAVGGN